MLEVLMAAAVLAGGQEAAPHVGPQAVSPRGSYTRSCSGDYVNRGRLYADCRDMRGRTRGTSIELNRCTDHDIANSDGLLVCGPHRGDYEDRGNGGGGRPDRPDRPGHGGGWNGGNNASITVFRDVDYRGPSMRFTGEVANLQNQRFNDMISSMRLQGEWEVCTDAHFRGYCQTFSEDTRNLTRWGLNDRISSIRPLRRQGGGRW